MTPQLTLQTPLQLPPDEIPSYLDKLWSQENLGNNGANTFSLLIWQPAWIEQELIRLGKLNGPITGNQSKEVIEESRKFILEENLPHSTSPLDKKVQDRLSSCDGGKAAEDLRGQHIDSSISALNPRRLITLAPTLNLNSPLETLVAAYCPLPEEISNNSTACGDVVVLRGSTKALKEGLSILNQVLPDEIPSWLWWNGSLDEAPELLKELSLPNKRLIIDSSLGDPYKCIKLLDARVTNGQAVNDLNWLRLRTWRETLAMIFDPPERRQSLENITNIDIDIEGDNPIQGLLFASWIADRLNWKFRTSSVQESNHIKGEFIRSDGEIVKLSLIPLPVGLPSIHPGQIVGLRLISKQTNVPDNSLCVILASESGECMRLEAGGMANMDLLEEVVPISDNNLEMDVARLLSSSRGSTSPLLSNAAPLAAKILNSSKKS